MIIKQIDKYNFIIKDINIINNIYDQDEINCSDRISFGISNLPDIDVKVGDYVKVIYTGETLVQALCLGIRRII